VDDSQDSLVWKVCFPHQGVNEALDLEMEHTGEEEEQVLPLL
jgi:hypothetical protein